MIGATFCSGIGAPEMAAPWIDWRFASEIEPFPREVLKERFGYKTPDDHNQGDPLLWGDMAEIEPDMWREHGLQLPEIIVAGTPCQDFSIAGLREGLKGERGNLTMKFVEICHAIVDARPDGRLKVLWENVPGVLSDKGNAFGNFLAAIVGADNAFPRPNGESWPSAGMVAGPRARLAWRVLDAQYFGVAQRRRRVFVVIDFGDAIDPAKVLFERQGLHGNSPPRREAGKDVAGTISARTQGGGGLGTDFDLAVGLQVAGTLDVGFGRRRGSGMNPNQLVAGSLTAGMHKGPRGTEAVEGNHIIPAQWPAETAPTLNAAFGDKMGLEDQHALGGAGLFVPVGALGDVSHALTSEGFDASEDGTGRGTPVIAFSAKDSNRGDNNASTHKVDASSTLSELRGKVGAEAFAKWGLGILNSLQGAEVLQSWMHGGKMDWSSDLKPFVVNCAQTFAEDSTGRALRKVWEYGPNGCSPQGRELAKQLAGKSGEALSVLSQFRAQASEELSDMRKTEQRSRFLRQALSKVQKIRRPHDGEGEPKHTNFAVRRLMPIEAARLQGFPDNHTAITYRGKPATDGPQYKGYGNSMAVPVIAWILERMA